MKKICKQFGLFAAILGWTVLLSGCSLLGINKEKAQSESSENMLYVILAGNFIEREVIF